ncbi:oligosaccharide flippase family protein [Haloferax sp. Atlit-4N]|uniref:oligosaccharide flippase family protein n=1 Tax=Haloferax sp. Atlit-4N TaxID=2077206 RepID=UPI001314DC87|nr:oligosaccharide flippase family protein [Haloferax sp. Atlit-4N]
MSSSRINLIRGFLSILSSSVLLIIISLITTPILTRVLGTASYGDYATVLAVFGISKVVSESGTFNGVRKYIAESRDQSEWDSKVINFYTLFSVVLGSVVVLLLYLSYFTGALEAIFGDLSQSYTILISLMIVSSLFFGLFRGALMGLGYEHYSEPLDVINNLAFSTIAVTLAVLGTGVIGPLIGKVTGFLLGAILAYILLVRKTDLKLFSLNLVDVSSNRLFDEKTKFGIYSIILSLLISSLYNVDILLVQLFVGGSQVGYYKASLVIAEFLWFVPLAVQYSLVHSSSEMWANNQHEKITDISSKVSRYTLLLVLLMCIGLSILADEFIPLYFGQQYTPAVVPLLLLLPGVLGLSIARPIFAIGQGKGALRSLILATAAAAVINFLLNLILIPQYGMNGAAIATSIGYGSMLIFHYWCAISIGFDPLSNLMSKKIVLIAAITYPILFVVESTIRSDLTSLVVIPILGLLIYIILALRWKVIEQDDVYRLPLTNNRIEKILSILRL